MDPQLRPIRRRDVSGLVGLLGQLGYPTTEALLHEGVVAVADVEMPPLTVDLVRETLEQVRRYEYGVTIGRRTGM